MIASSSFAGNRWNIKVIQVNGETGLAEVKLSAWTKLNDKAWQVWEKVKGCSCLPYPVEEVERREAPDPKRT